MCVCERERERSPPPHTHIQRERERKKERKKERKRERKKERKKERRRRRKQEEDTVYQKSLHYKSVRTSQIPSINNHTSGHRKIQYSKVNPRGRNLVGHVAEELPENGHISSSVLLPC